MTIETWAITRPIPYARNARKIPQCAIDKVAASIQEFGFRQPLVVDTERVIIAGHVRLLAAQKLELKEVPVHVAKGLTPAQVRAYRLMDNRSHQEAEWDLELLAPELSDLNELAFDLLLTGFDEREWSELLAEKTEGLTDEDEAAAVQPFAIAEPGDLWILGNHRLLCGDSTSMDEASLYVCHSSSWQREFQKAMEEAGFAVRCQIIWAKNTFAWGFGRYKFQHEPIFYAHVAGKTDAWYGDKSQFNAMAGEETGCKPPAPHHEAD